MDELKQKRTFNEINTLVNNKNKKETLRSMPLDELHNIINSTNDMKLLEAAENEYLRRMCPTDDAKWFLDEDWRDNESY